MANALLFLKPKIVHFTYINNENIPILDNTFKELNKEVTIKYSYYKEDKTEWTETYI